MRMPQRGATRISASVTQVAELSAGVLFPVSLVGLQEIGDGIIIPKNDQMKSRIQSILFLYSSLLLCALAFSATGRNMN